ncbi:MAG: GIY-YIG nuclease family protein [Candidatus Taylorbacteria bacterium]|nr:GIY-YIG nuclease family protein [Candidatus Taylorbacteria bacterium]
MNHFVYILKCSDRTLYTGYTNDIKKRVLAHNSLKTGARYTKARRPVVLVHFEKFRSKSKAMKREWEIKAMTRKEKLSIIKNIRIK